MSVRESIAANIVSVLDGVSSIELVTREPFDIEELSQAQYPAVWIETASEEREDAAINQRSGAITYLITGFVTGSTIDTNRNQLIEDIEEELELDRTRGGNALNSYVSAVDTDKGVIHPIGGVEITLTAEYFYTTGST
jgi:hypothetical protein